MPQAASRSVSVSGILIKRLNRRINFDISSSEEMLSRLITLGGTAKKATILTCPIQNTNRIERVSKVALMAAMKLPAGLQEFGN
jgi:hypothetical protein